MAGLKFLSGEDKEAQYQFYGLIVFIGIIFWIQIRITVFINVPLIFWELIPYASIVIALFYLYSFAPLKKKNESQGQVQAIDYADSMIRRGKKRPEDLMLPFKEVYEVPINFDENGSLIAKFKSNTYKKHYVSYLEAQLTPNISNETTEISEKNLKSLLEVLTLKLPDMREEDLLKNIIKVSKEGDKKKNKELSFDEDSLDTIEGNELDMANLDLNQITDDEKAILNELHIYWVILDSPQNYENEKEEWNQLFIIIPHFKYEEAMATGKGQGFYNNWPVILKECFCFWEHLWDLTGNVQVLYLAFSENFDRPYLEPLKNLKASAYAFVQLKVMETWMNDLEVKPERLEKTRDHYREKARALSETLSDVVQDEANDNIVFSKFLNNPSQKKLIAEIEKYKRRFIYALSGVLIGLLSMLVIIAFLI